MATSRNLSSGYSAAYPGARTVSGGGGLVKYRSSIGGSKDRFEDAMSRISGSVTKPAPKPLEEGESPYGGMWNQNQMPLAVTPTRTEVARPTAPTMPVFKAPEYDEGEVRSLSRKRSAPQISKLREAVQVASSKTFDNPNVQRMTLRSALAGYGEGLGAVTGAADESARREYGQRYALEQQEALTNYNARMKKTMQDWQNSWSLYNRAIDMSTPRY